MQVQWFVLFITNLDLLDKDTLQASWAFTSGLSLMITVGEINLHLLKNAQSTLSLFTFSYLPTLSISNFQLNECEISNVANHLSYLIFEFFDCIRVQSHYDIVMTTTTEIASDLNRKAETLESKTCPCI